MTKTGILTDHIQIEQANIAFAYKLDVYCIGTGVCAKSLGISFTLVTYFYVMIYLFSSCFRNVQCCVPCPATVVILPVLFYLTVEVTACYCLQNLQEEVMRGKPGYEHLNEPLHLVIEAELPAEIVDIRLMQAREILDDMLKPVVGHLCLCFFVNLPFSVLVPVSTMLSTYSGLGFIIYAYMLKYF